MEKFSFKNDSIEIEPEVMEQIEPEKQLELVEQLEPMKQLELVEQLEPIKQLEPVEQLESVEQLEPIKSEPDASLYKEDKQLEKEELETVSSCNQDIQGEVEETGETGEVEIYRNITSSRDLENSCMVETSEFSALDLGASFRGDLKLIETGDVDKEIKDARADSPEEGQWVGDKMTEFNEDIRLHVFSRTSCSTPLSGRMLADISVDDLELLPTNLEDLDLLPSTLEVSLRLQSAQKNRGSSAPAPEKSSRHHQSLKKSYGSGISHDETVAGSLIPATGESFLEEGNGLIETSFANLKLITDETAFGSFISPDFGTSYAWSFSSSDEPDHTSDAQDVMQVGVYIPSKIKIDFLIIFFFLQLIVFPCLMAVKEKN